MENVQQPTILLVDDVPENLKLLITFLGNAGFRIVVAQNGAAALQRAEHARPDIILLDVLMPDMDGFETCRRLKENEATRNIPVIFMTSLAETVDKVTGFELGGVDYLTKPVQHEEVLARINAHLTIQKLQQQLQNQNVRLEEQNAQLAEQNQRFQTLADATFEGILIHDQGRILEVNQALEKMFGYQRVNVLGRDVAEFVAPASRQVVLAHLQTSADTPYEAEGVRQDGAIFPFESQARTIPYQGCEARVVAIRDLSWRQVVEEEKQHLLSATIQDRYKFGGMIGKSPIMQDVYQTIIKAAASEASVLIYGESGTGKELAAQTIHHLSKRREKPCVPVNCGAIPENLFESEFFGHRKGAFTGADRDKAGFFEAAHGGTLFLDEVGELPLAMQVKLLRVLQNGEYTPVGDTHLKHVDVRLIAATNKPPEILREQGVMRTDFFYRIYVMVIDLPPLRSRKEDLPLLVEHFLAHYSAGQDATPPTIPGHIVGAFMQHDWPGNIRELQNAVQRYLAGEPLNFLPARRAAPEDLITNNVAGLDGVSLSATVEAYEKRLIASILDQNQGNVEKTAQTLQIPLRTLYGKIKKYGLR